MFVHGLNGSPHNTWATQKTGIFWPADLLPRTLEGLSVRILTYGYNAHVSFFADGASKDNILNHAEHLAGLLHAKRTVSSNGG